MKYDTITAEVKEVFWQEIEKANSILLSSHISPDNDSISSVLGLYSVIAKNYPGKKIRMVYTGQVQARFSFMRNFDKIESLEDAALALEGSDLLILLDAGNYGRMSPSIDRIQAFSTKVCVDHHTSVPDRFDLSIIDTTAPSCAELVYELCKEKGIDKEEAEILLLGILSDTGNFVYLKSHQGRTLIVAKELIEIGQINIQELYSRFPGYSQGTIEVIRELMNNLNYAEVEGRIPFSYSFVRRGWIEERGVSQIDLTAGKDIFISQYIKSAEGYPWGFTVIPRPEGVCNISARSLPKGENVRLIMEAFCGGGGHDLAAGATVKGESDPEKVAERLIEWLNKKRGLTA